jgi:hypothetical protein
MEQSPSSEANSHSASQEIPRLLWNLKVHYSLRNSPPFVPILSQMHAVRTFLPNFSKIIYNILPSTPSSFKWPLRFMISNQNILLFLISLMHATCPIHLVDFISPLNDNEVFSILGLFND